MAVRAYVLIEVSIGKVPRVVDKIRSLPDIVDADVVTGPYDIIAVIEAESAEGVGQLVMRQIRGIPGINYTLTCVTVGE